MRFPEFSGEWEKFRNCTLFKVISEKNKNYEFSTVLSASQTEGMVLRDSLGIDIKFEEDSIKTYKIVRNGDYVAHLRSFQGGFAFSDKTGVCSPAYTILRPSETISYGFLKPYFMSRKFIDSLRIVTYGIRDGKSISVEEWLKLYTCIPKKIEQQKISKFLRLIDNRIDTQKKIIEDLKKLKDAITHSHYRNELSHSPMVYIGQYITQVSKRNKDAKIDRVLSVSNKYGFINQDEQFEDREVASADTSNYKVVHKGDFAYNPARINVGSVARLQEFENGIVSPMYVCFTAKKGLLPAYFELYLCTSIFKHEMNKRLEGSVRLCLTYESLCNIKIALPEINVQKDFVSKVSTILTQISAEERLLYLYHNCKQYFLSQMFI